jgi:hypothetical protein
VTLIFAGLPASGLVAHTLPVLLKQPSGLGASDDDDGDPELAAPLDFLSLLHAAATKTKLTSRQRSALPRRCLTKADLLVG